jgi:hypothetical protein
MSIFYTVRKYRQNHKARITLIAKPDKDTIRKQQTNIIYEYGHKNSQKLLTAQI